MERAGQIERAEPLGFGSLLREHRIQAGLTQEALAERAGLSPRGVSALERGQHQPYRDTAERLAQALGLQGAALKRFLLAGRPRPHGLSTRQEPANTLSPSVTPRVVRATPSPDRILHNLPSQLTSFVGREHEMAEVKRLLQTTRLLTLTGTGGCGKTRLAYQVAEQLLAEQPGGFPQGIWQVELASLTHPDQVAQTIALTLGLRPSPSRPVVGILESFLETRRLLLLLDNCEHLLDGVARLADSLLRRCPGLKVLATSREALRISGETTWRVPPLSLPRDDGLPPVEGLTGYEAVRLFVERSRAGRPDFALSERNASAVLDICRRLDGMPLALELAASRLRVLSAEQLSTRLDDRFRLLTGGSRTALPRQQTLRAAIDWSYDLLDEEERELLRRLSVFAGGWTLEAAEAVCRRDAIAAEDVLDLLAHRVERSLVVAVEGPGGETRFRLLETIREYAREKLAASDERAEVQGSHANYYLEQVEDGAPQPLIVATREWVDRLEVERANVRAALRWFLDIGDVERGFVWPAPSPPSGPTAVRARRGALTWPRSSSIPLPASAHWVRLRSPSLPT